MLLDLKRGAIMVRRRGGGVSYFPSPSNPVCILGLLKISPRRKDSLSKSQVTLHLVKESLYKRRYTFRRPCTTACQVCWAMGTHKLKQCTLSSEEKNICTGLTRAAKAGKSLLHRHDEPNKPTKDGSLSFVLIEFPFTSVSTVSTQQGLLLSGLSVC